MVTTFRAHYQNMETFVVALISAQVLASRQKLHEHGRDYRIIAQRHRGVPYVMQKAASQAAHVCYLNTESIVVLFFTVIITFLTPLNWRRSDQRIPVS